MYYYKYMLKSVPTSKATTQPSPGYRSMLVFLCALALVVLAGCAGGGASVPSARATACIGAIALSVGGCQQNQIPPTPKSAHTAFCVYVDYTNSVGISAAPQIKAAKFDCIRTYYYSPRASYAWVSPAIASGLSFIFVIPSPTVADMSDPTAYIADVQSAMHRWPGQSWELTAEPDQGMNVPAYVRPSVVLTPAQYVGFFRSVIPSMRAADPSARIISGGAVGKGGMDPNWVAEISGLWPLVDNIGIHAYPPPWLQNPIPTLPAIFAAILTQTGKPAIMTEWGLAQRYAPLKPGDPWPNPLTQAQAASDMTQMVSTVDGITPIFGVYEWTNNDDPWAATEGFGIVGTPELAAFTSARGLLAAAPIH